MRATIVATNAPFADPFWTALGYRPGGAATPYLAGEEPTTALAWTRDLPTGPSPDRFADVRVDPLLQDVRASFGKQAADS